MSFTFNVAKGKIRAYAQLTGANDALVLVPLEAAGLEAEATMKDADTLAAVLAGTSNEAAAGRKTLVNVTDTVDDTGDQVLLDADDVAYAAGESVGNQVGAWLICYDPDTTAGTDADLVPLTKHDLTWTPDGNAFTVQFANFAVCS